MQLSETSTYTGLHNRRGLSMIYNGQIDNVSKCCRCLPSLHCNRIAKIDTITGIV